MRGRAVGNATLTETFGLSYRLGRARTTLSTEAALIASFEDGITQRHSSREGRIIYVSIRLVVPACIPRRNPRTPQGVIAAV